MKIRNAQTKKNKSKIVKLQNSLLLVIINIALVLLLVTIFGTPAPDIKMNKLNNVSQFSDLQSNLFPVEGFKTKIVLGDVAPRLVQEGAIDIEKFKQVYGNRLTAEQLKFLAEPSIEPLTITPSNANFLINVLWPLGIANKNPILDEAAKYDGIGNLASTGGWTLSKNDSMNYFNKLELVKLTAEQQTNFEEVAKNAYRPCCNNPTSFPDCNHGAALLALLELGASQGLTKSELYTLALQANTLWFPQQYLSTAALYKSQGKDYWSDAKNIMGFNYSSSSGWSKNVYKPLQAAGLVPTAQGGGSCGV